VSPKNAKGQYARIIERIFQDRFKKNARAIDFTREDLRSTADALGVKLPSNIGDVVYSFRYRAKFPESILKTCKPGEAWHIFPNGPAKYQFRLLRDAGIAPRPDLIETKVLGATPEVIGKYAQSDEQALLAIVRYNRLIDTFTGITAYSLQNHLRTTVEGLGQIEIDELYIGVDKKGQYYVLPVQAKGKGDRLGVVQVWQDVACCKVKFPNLVCRPIGVQFMKDGIVAMFELTVETSGEMRVVEERHYRLVAKDESQG
jgi:hypothetical protein